MLEFFTWFQDFATTLADFFMNTITGIGQIIKAFPDILDLTTDSITYLPAFMSAFATITITLSIVMFVVGRQTGGGE